MAILHVFVSDDDLEALQTESRDLCRSVEDLAESAVSEAVLQWKRDQPAPSRQEPLL